LFHDDVLPCTLAAILQSRRAALSIAKALLLSNDAHFSHVDKWLDKSAAARRGQTQRTSVAAHE
jgi:hypothetical protein